MYNGIFIIFGLVHITFSLILYFKIFFFFFFGITYFSNKDSMSKKYYTFMIIEIENVINLKIKEIEYKKIEYYKIIVEAIFSRKKIMIRTLYHIYKILYKIRSIL